MPAPQTRKRGTNSPTRAQVARSVLADCVPREELSGAMARLTGLMATGYVIGPLVRPAPPRSPGRLRPRRDSALPSRRGSSADTSPRRSASRWRSRSSRSWSLSRPAFSLRRTRGCVVRTPAWKIRILNF